jgi:hypothetical protein
MRARPRIFVEGLTMSGLVMLGISWVPHIKQSKFQTRRQCLRATPCTEQTGHFWNGNCAVNSASSGVTADIVSDCTRSKSVRATSAILTAADSSSPKSSTSTYRPSMPTCANRSTRSQWLKFASRASQPERSSSATGTTIFGKGRSVKSPPAQAAAAPVRSATRGVTNSQRPHR